MSGLLRRIKRSRAADAGEPPLGGEAAAPDAAPAPAEPGVGPATPPPAGLDPAETALRAPAGRRGRLRRRLRYLRRARELMLRDLGGLLYEVHRTGGGQVEPHATVIDAKVQRLTVVDTEAHAIEQALGSPRAQAVVFQPGVGGTCAVCGELYGSAAHFCSNCGAPVAAAAEPGPAVPPSPEAPPVPEAPASLLAPAREATAPAGDEQPTEALPTETPATGDALAPPAKPQEPEPGRGETDADQPAHPSNGREERTPPPMSSGDPLFTRERS